MVVGDEIRVHHGEGRLTQTTSLRNVRWLGAIFILFLLGVLARVGDLQVANGATYRDKSERNTFDRQTVIPSRGIIFDRNGVPMAWNDGDADRDVPVRRYLGEGFSSLLGFVHYPKKDAAGAYYRSRTKGVGGLEERHNETLAGQNGSIVFEKNVVGDVVSRLHLERPVQGEDIAVSVDAELQRALYKFMEAVAREGSFLGGGATIIDIHTGEILSLVSYPDFDNNVLTGDFSGEEEEVYLRNRDDGSFVNRAVSGLYIPGSTVKPFFAAAALEEEIVSTEDTVVSDGHITVQSPYDEETVYVYKDWKRHGELDIVGAIAWSSNIFFYHIGGGYDHIAEGLGIDRLKFYAGMFGFGRSTDVGMFREPDGLVPTPEWKSRVYDDEWRIGDTFNTVIGQYAFQVTPLQLARATAAIANGGHMIEPHLEKGRRSKKTRLAVSDETLRIVQRGMREAVTDGTAQVLNTGRYALAAKTGTAQIGRTGQLNSLLIGFFPYDAPRYAFALVMERGNETGDALKLARRLFDWMAAERTAYLRL